MEGFREVCSNSSSGIFQLKKVHIVDEDKQDKGATENIAADTCS